jgi:hypothetical protein
MTSQNKDKHGVKRKSEMMEAGSSGEFSSSYNNMPMSKHKKNGGKGDNRREDAMSSKDIRQNALAGAEEPRKAQALGAWNPKATVVKGAKIDHHNSTSIMLFYQYIQPLWSEQRKQDALDMVSKVVCVCVCVCVCVFVYLCVCVCVCVICIPSSVFLF